MRRSVLALLAVLVLGGAAAADVVWPARLPAPRRVAATAPGGVWGCPFVSPGKDLGRAWLHLANAGAEASSIRITYVRDGAGPVVTTMAVGARNAVSIELNPALRRPTGAIVEYAGGDVFVSRTAIVNDARAHRLGGIGAGCSRASTGLLALPTGSTLNADTTLFILNPATSDATMDISLLTREDELRPELLQGFVIPARSRRAVRIGDYAFDAPGAGAVIRVRSGRIVADGVLSSSAGVALIPAQTARPVLVGLATTERGTARFDALAPGENDVVLQASQLTTLNRTVLAVPSENGLEPRAPTAFAISSGRSPVAAVTLFASSGGPIVAGTRWGVGKAPRVDLVAAPGVVPGRRLVAVSGPPANGARTKIVIANPGERAAAVTLTLLHSRPQAPLGVRTVEAGRVVVLEVGNVGGVIGVEASSDAPVAMMLTGFTPQQRFLAAFAITAFPVVDPPRVAVEIDERLGVPAL